MVKNASPILVALQAATHSETTAVEFMEAHRWPAGTACPRCGSLNVYKMTSASGERNKDYRWRCRDCKTKKMFTVRTATVFEQTRLPMRVWVYAFWRACASKKGISALQLSREMQITHKSALFVLRRLRHGLGNDGVIKGKMKGTIEVDETYVGGKPRAPRDAREKWSAKIPVVAAVQRHGEVRYRMMERVTADRMSEFVAGNIDLTCRVMTDESPAYTKLGRKFAGGHHTVNHSHKEYARKGGFHSNTVESAFSLLKRGIMGTFHSVSRKHLPNYLNEFQYRWNTRRVDDATRISRAIRQVDGKRITYRESVDNPPYLIG